VAVCKQCHAILDAEKAAKHGLGPAARESTAKAPADSNGEGAAAKQGDRKK
jgi:hypothetical protein